jgi:serine/threonine protein kinase
MAASIGAPGTAENLPRRFGRYLLFDHIGRGGMADIYLARVETELGAARRVVVKQILPELSAEPRFARMLIDEAKLVAGLHHANIAQVLDLGRENERLFIAMEYVEGFDLNVLLRTLSKQRIALPAEFALFVVRDMLAALDFAHRATDASGKPLAIVHRDVSPSNVLISFEGEVKLCDFGIAKALGFDAASMPGAPRPSDTGTGERSRIAGKAAYMSPEHARGDAIDARADLFAAGIVLWELAAGRRLYRGNDEEMLSQAREGTVPPLPERGLPRQEELQAILDRAFQVDPAARWQTASEMLRAIDDYAVRSKLFASQLRFGSFLSQHFEMDVVAARRQRELAAESFVEPQLAPSSSIETLPDTPAPTLETPMLEKPISSKPPPSPAAVELAAHDTRRTKSVPAPPEKRSSATLWIALAIFLLVLPLGAALAWFLLG